MHFTYKYNFLLFLWFLGSYLPANAWNIKIFFTLLISLNYGNRALEEN